MRSTSARLCVSFVVAFLSVGCASGPHSDTRCNLPQETPRARVPLPQIPDGGLQGFADYHAHMFSEEGFGGFLFQGKAFVPKPEPEAIAEALAACQHTRVPHFVTRAVVEGAGDGAHGPDGYPQFNTWPRYTSHTHQQMYIDWLYRAYTYGLRLVTIVATNSETLCDFTYHLNPCSDVEAVKLEIDAIHNMASYVAANEGGWLEIATSAAQAEKIVGSGRLAVVIGIEVDSLFGCGIGPRGEVCDDAEVVKRLDGAYREQDVRQITPIHLVDSAFGGSAVFDERLNANHFYLRGYYQSLRDCTDEGVEWRLRGKDALPAGANLLIFFHSGRTYDPHVPASLVGAQGHCNGLGLTPLGVSLLREMMKRGMLIDAEHMSERSLNDTFRIADEAGYPIMLSHAWFRDLKLPTGALGADPAFQQDHWNEQRSEMHRRAETLAHVRRSGGVVGVVTNQGYVLAAPGSPVANDCDTSSKSVAQALIYAVEQMGGAGVGLGSDVNGFNGQPSPRFGPLACGGLYADPGVRRRQEEAQDKRLKYESTTIDGKRQLTRSTAGVRQFDFNTMGLAHYGMIPDLIEDLRSNGVPLQTLDTLLRSAAAYIEMWKRAETRAESLSLEKR